MSKYWEGYSGSSIAGFRSAVSVTAPKWKGAPVGQSELVVQCMKNIDLKRPSEPAYATTWDLDLLTDWLNTFPSNQQTTMELLRMKCILLFKILTMARSSDVEYVSFHSIAINGNRLSGKFKPPKGYRRGSDLRFDWEGCPEKENLCIVRAWSEYLRRTVGARRELDRVFVTLYPPFKEISRQRIAKVTLEAMERSGIDITKFKAHSTRMASASKSLDLGASVDEVMKQGRWRSRSVFMAFYNRAKPRNFTSLLLDTPNLQR
jgi:integrase